MPHRQPPLLPAPTAVHLQRVGHCMQQCASLPAGFYDDIQISCLCLCPYFVYPEGQARVICSQPLALQAASHEGGAQALAVQAANLHLLAQLLVHQVVAGTPVEAAAVEQLGGRLAAAKCIEV